jgi:hypothetical protein
MYTINPKLIAALTTIAVAAPVTGAEAASQRHYAQREVGTTAQTQRHYGHSRHYSRSPVERLNRKGQPLQPQLALRINDEHHAHLPARPTPPQRAAPRT